MNKINTNDSFKQKVFVQLCRCELTLLSNGSDAKVSICAFLYSFDDIRAWLEHQITRSFCQISADLPLTNDERACCQADTARNHPVTKLCDIIHSRLGVV